MSAATDASRPTDTAVERAVASTLANDTRFTRATHLVRAEGRAAHRRNRLVTTRAARVDNTRETPTRTRSRRA
jgi:hypothetical protein